MTQNPLQQFFRQPKIYIKLPSMGVYNRPGVIQGDVSNLPVFGMTGMDEILMKTPDALLSGESTVRVIESCCPFIKDAWDVSSLDLDLLLVAIRIATFGSNMHVTHTCPSCRAENDYEVNLTTLIDHFSNFRYDNKILLSSMNIKLQPLTYRQNTAFSVRNFELQQKMSQISSIDSETERAAILADIFKDISMMQHEIYVTSIESIEVNNKIVSERAFIDEFLKNCDADLISEIKTFINKSRESLEMPPFDVKCDNCGHEAKVSVNLDQSSFFDRA